MSTPRYVYFDSLDDYFKKEEVQSDVNKMSFFSTRIKNKEGLLSSGTGFFGVGQPKEANNVTKALELLKQSVETEKSIEREYVVQLIDRAKTLKQDERYADFVDGLIVQLNALFKDDSSFNYPDFINILNLLLQGQDNYDAILKYEKDRQESLKDILTQIRNAHFEQFSTKGEKNGYKKTRTNRRYNRYLTKDGTLDPSFFEEEYLRSHGYSGVEQIEDYFKDLKPEVSALVADNVKKGLMRAIQNYQYQFLDFVDSSRFITYLEQKLKDDISTIIKDASSNPSIQQRGEKLIDDLFAITPKILNILPDMIYGQDYNYSGHSATSSLFEGAADIILACEKDPFIQKIINHTFTIQVLDKKGNVINKTINDVNSGVTQMQKLINEIKKAQQDLSNTSKPTDIEALKKSIKNFKNSLSRLARQVISNNPTDEYFWVRGYKAKFTVQKWSIIEDISALVQMALGAAGVVPHNANRRADFLNLITSVDIDGGDPRTIQRMQQRILENFTDAFNAQLLTPIDPNVNSTSKKATAQFNIANGMVALQQGLQKMYDTYTSTRESSDNPLKDFKDFLEKTILVTGTAKNFTQYNPDIGFVAGSLGPNIFAQIDNFAKIFEQAGVPFSDNLHEWLYTAVINCSRFTHGEELKDPIEKYLSLLGSFAIFDEGGAEIGQIANTWKAHIQISSRSKTFVTAKIIHIYELNGIYFPGSYILQRVYDRLTKVMSTVEGKADSNKDGVRIRATANPGLINKDIKDLQKRWEDVYTKATNPNITSIHVTFLAGLADIITELQEAMKDPLS